MLVSAWVVGSLLCVGLIDSVTTLASCQYFAPSLSAVTIAPVPRRLVVFADDVTVGINQTLENDDGRFDLDLFTQTRARDFIRDRCPFALEAYDVLVPLAFKSDLFRYCALWVEPGVYMDFDRAIVHPIDTINQTGELLLIRDMMSLRGCYKGGTTGVWQGFLISKVAKSRVLECAMRGIADMARRRLRMRDRLDFTGPGRLAGCVTHASDATFVGYVPTGASKDILRSNGDILLKETAVERSGAHWTTYGYDVYAQ